MKSILLQILTLDGLGYFKTGRLPNFSCGVMDSGNDADPMHYA